MKTNPLTLLAATCSKIGSQPLPHHQPSGHQQQPVIKLNSGQLTLSSPASQLSSTVHQVPQPSLVLNGQVLNGIQAGTVGNSLSYNLVQPQPVMTVNLQGLAGHDQTMLTQIPIAQMQQPSVPIGSDGSVPVILQNGQLTVAPSQPAATAPTLATNSNNLQYLSIKQGDQVQHVPVIQQSPQLLTVPIQVPVASLNGLPIFQTHHVPVQALQAVLQSSASGEQLLPQQNVVDIPSFLQNSVAEANAQSMSSTDPTSDSVAQNDTNSLANAAPHNAGALMIKPEPKSDGTNTPDGQQQKKTKRKVVEPCQVLPKQTDSLPQTIFQAVSSQNCEQLQFAANPIFVTGGQAAPSLQSLQIIGGNSNLVQAGTTSAPIILQTLNAQQVNKSFYQLSETFTIYKQLFFKIIGAFKPVCWSGAA